jgi:uncharacterized protein YoxC/rubrerythrin
MSQIIVRQYRCFEPLNWDQDAQDHLWRMNALWNQLVENEQTLYQRYRDVMSEDDTVAGLEAEIEGLQGQLEEAETKRNEIRKEIRKKKGPETAETDERIKTVKAQLKELRAQARDARKAAKTQMAPRLSALNDERKELTKTAYQNSGLWWGNYNGVIDSFRVAHSRCMKTGGQLRFHRFDGQGRFRNQIQGGMTVDELVSGTKNQLSMKIIDADKFSQLTGRSNNLKPGSSRGKKRSYGLLKFTIYTGKDEDGKNFRRTLDFPVLIHRPLPKGDDVKIKEAILKREKLGPGEFRWHITFTLSQEDTETKGENTTGPACGLHLGWKTVEGGLRIATLADDKGVKHFVMPAAILATYTYLKALQSEIDKATAENYNWIKDILTDPPEALIEPLERIRRSKHPHPAKFASLVRAWDECPQFLTECYHAAQIRSEGVRKKESELANLRDKVIARRQDLYRCWAKEIAQSYGHIVVPGYNLAQTGKKENDKGEANELLAIAKRNRVIASVGLLREWIVKQAAKEGSEVSLHKGKSTTLCAGCGQEVPRQETDFWRCPSCKAIFDKDENAAFSLLRTLSDSAVM